jgi:uncharacterized repeat protein (TIGR03803 family)
MTNPSPTRHTVALLPMILGVAYALAATTGARTQTPTETVLLSFSDFPNGANPYAPLALAPDGNLYGTTNQGGAADLGEVFMMTPSGKLTVLHSFQGGTDGANPYSGVALDSAGNLYGTTYAGGSGNAGVVYELDASGQETVLYSFTGGADGGNPYGGVVLDSSGNLYGTTYNGGGSKAGVVYKVTAPGQETVLYTFTGGTDGGNPYAGVILDSSGNLYGTTLYGGSTTCTYGCGVVYELNTAGSETVLYSFVGGPEGTAWPYAGVILDTSGNLYGAASVGGQNDGGVVYKLNAAGSLTALVNFAPTKGPSKPEAGLVMDSDGNLYGTTQQSNGGEGPGSVFKVNAAGKLTSLYSFPGASRSQGVPAGASGGVVLDGAGNIYGATAYGGVSGMVYSLAPSGKETTLYSFAGAPGGTEPAAGVCRDSKGNLYGAAASGGKTNFGLVYKLDPSGHETVLYSFQGGAGGERPYYTPAIDGAGNVYGAASGGADGFGVVYEIDTSGQETVLHTFTGGDDGGYPSVVILDKAGDVYGTAWYGEAGGGVVYKIDPAGQQTVLYSFTGGPDGGFPNSLTLDGAGNLYGTAQSGGAGAGVVFELDASGSETVLYTFPVDSYGVGPEGADPVGVVLDSAGNLYGAAGAGGSDTSVGSGLVFELDSAGSYTVLYRFTGGADGGGPVSAPLLGPTGDLYGTTIGGGVTGCEGSCGVVYRVATSGKETAVYSFTGGADGANPQAGVIAGAKGDLYGTTPSGGKGGFNDLSLSGAGVVFKIAP